METIITQLLKVAMDLLTLVDAIVTFYPNKIAELTAQIGALQAEIARLNEVIATDPDRAQLEEAIARIAALGVEVTTLRAEREEAIAKLTPLLPPTP